MGQVIIVHGPTRAGKSSQAKLLAERHGYIYISSGELLRSSQEPVIMERMAQGLLARSEDIERLMKIALAAVPSKQGIVIDGFPRKLNEFDSLQEWLAEQGREIERVIEVYIPPEESHRRGEHRGRGDDEYEAVEMKWRWYRSDTGAVLEACRQKGWLRSVDGVGSREEVARRIESALSQ